MAARSEPEPVKGEDASQSSRKGQKPRLSQPVYTLRAKHVFAAKTYFDPDFGDITPNRDLYNFILTVHHGASLEVSKTPLKELGRMSLEDLRLDEHIKGKHLVLRTLEPAYATFDSIMNVVEDHLGNAVVFSLHNFPIVKNSDLNDVFPVGMIFALKEPFCREAEDGECILYCGCPSDMIFIYEGHDNFKFARGIAWQNDVMHNYALIPPLPNCAIDWFARGKSLTGDGRLESATRCYYLALDYAKRFGAEEGLTELINLEMAEVWAKRGYHELSLDFTKKILHFDSDHVRANYTAGVACYQLKHYKDAKRHFEKCVINDPHHATAELEGEKCVTRIEEKEIGEFQMENMFFARRDAPLMPIETADYKNAMELIFLRGKGRGIFATRHLEPGTLLVVSKAIAFFWKSNGLQIAETKVWKSLLAQLIKIIMSNPKTLGGVIYRLFDGQHVAKDEHPKVFCLERAKEEPIVDVRKLSGIIMNNLFGEGCDIYRVKDTFSEGSTNKSGCGLFPWPSYFNHSCLPNASVNEFNDVMVIKSIQYIRKGEEIFLPYISWKAPFSIRQMYFAKRGFRCGCQLCQSEEKLSPAVHAKRHSLMLEYQAINRRLNDGKVRNLRQLLDYLHNLVEKYESTYDYSGEFPHKVPMSALYALLAKAHSPEIAGASWDPKEEIKYHQLALKCLGFNLQDMMKSLKKDKSSKEPNALLDPSVFYTVASLVFVYSHIEKLDYKKRLDQNPT